MENKNFRLQVVTPNKILFDEEVTSLTAKAIDGDIGILKGHQPLITMLDIGVLKIKKQEQLTFFALYEGVLKVSNESVVILTDNAESKEEISIERAKKAKERAEQRLQQKEGNTDFKRAELALKRALVRLRVSEIK